MNNKVILDTFNELWITYSDGIKVLDEMNKFSSSIDEQRKTVRSYFEYLMNNNWIDTDEIKELLKTQTKQLNNIINDLYYNWKWSLIDQISVNIWEAYLNEEYDKISITNLDSWEILILNSVVNEKYTNLITAYKLLKSENTPIFSVTIISEINTKWYEYLLKDSRVLN
jgi:hypothetical protein